MKSATLETSNPNIKLVEPDINRDSYLGVDWLREQMGRNTLKLMGVSDKENKETTLDEERKRVSGFINGKDQLNWMIQHEDKVVGAIWVDLVQKGNLQAPSIHIMVGDPKARGKGIGDTSIQAVIDYLKQSGYSTIYSRHLLENHAINRVFEKRGFQKDGDDYQDSDGLNWQNVLLELR